MTCIITVTDFITVLCLDQIIIRCQLLDHLAVQLEGLITGGFADAAGQIVPAHLV